MMPAFCLFCCIGSGFFAIELDTDTDVALFLKGQRIEAGQLYKTELLNGPKIVKIEVRFVAGDVVCRQYVEIEITPNRCDVYKVRVIVGARPYVYSC